VSAGILARQHGERRIMMDNRKFLIFGFLICVAAAIAYTFVFADLPFVTSPTSPDGAPIEVQVPAPAPQPPAP
jgi:hypothetical protein